MIKERIKGLLIGCAYGDSLGMPSEMMTQSQIKNRFERIVELLPSSEYDFFKRKFSKGQVTDDTLNTLLVCDTIIESNGYFDTNRYINKLQTWMSENPDIVPFTFGPSTIKALNLLKNGIDIPESGKYGTTNGSAMKASPLGVICDYNKPDELIKIVYSLCLPTHNTKIAISGACIIAAIVSYVIRGGKDIDIIWHIAFDYCDKIGDLGNILPTPSLKTRLEYIKSMLDRNYDISILEDIYDLFGTGIETIETIPSVLSILTISKCHPLKTAVLAANIGGDTDTIGAIACGIAGAMHPNEFKQDDIELLAKTNTIDFDWYTDKLFDLYER